MNYEYFVLLVFKLIGGAFNVTVWFGLFGFNGISTIVGYLMPNPFLYI